MAPQSRVTPSLRRPRTLVFNDVCALAEALPGAEVGTSYGTPALKVRDKSFCRLWEDGTTLVLKVPFAVRDHLLATAPETYFVTDHYRGYPAVLVRLAATNAVDLLPLLEEAWRQVAPKRMRRAFEARTGGTPDGVAGRFSHDDEISDTRMTLASPGYSGTPLAKKLGLKESTCFMPVNAPSGYLAWLGMLPPGAAPSARVSAAVDIVHLFSTNRAHLALELNRLRTALRADAAIWVSWPKKAAKVPTDITEDVIREVALPLGFVDIKVCAVTDVWSGLKLVVRKELRPAVRARTL